MLPEPVGKGLLQNSTVQPMKIEIDRTRPSSYLGECRARVITLLHKKSNSISDGNLLRFAFPTVFKRLKEETIARFLFSNRRQETALLLFRGKAFAD